MGEQAGAFQFQGPIFYEPYSCIPDITQNVSPDRSKSASPFTYNPCYPVLPVVVDRRDFPTPYGFDPLKRIYGGF